MFFMTGSLYTIKFEFSYVFFLFKIVLKSTRIDRNLKNTFWIRHFTDTCPTGVIWVSVSDSRIGY